MADNSNLPNQVIITEIIDDIVAVLQSGGTILYPTDTIWGLGCDPFNKIAVDHIFTVKQRDPSKPLILLVDSISMLKRYVQHIHPRVETLLHYHRQPLTVIYKANDNLPSYLSSDDKTVAIRLVRDPFCCKIVKDFGYPVISTSANISDQAFPKNFEEINPEIITQVNYIVRYKQNDRTLVTPSVIARFNHKGDLIFLRN